MTSYANHQCQAEFKNCASCIEYWVTSYLFHEYSMAISLFESLKVMMNKHFLSTRSIMCLVSFHVIGSTIVLRKPTCGGTYHVFAYLYYVATFRATQAVFYSVTKTEKGSPQ